MTATLRVVLDQLCTTTDPDLETAERELARALVRSAPPGCEVAAIVPSGDADAVTAAVPGLADVARMRLARRELAGAWQMGIAAGTAGGMIHAPSLLAPLVRHDRVHDGDQTVVTLWDLRAWERPETLSRASAMWQRGMLKRAERHADAVVVPTHATAEALGAIARLGQRIRVIPGAAPEGFAAPTDAVGRRRTLRVPEEAVVLDGAASRAELTAAVESLARAGIDAPLVVLGADPDAEAWIVDAATAAGLAPDRLHVRPSLPDADRAAVLHTAAAYLAPAADSAFPWRLLEALALGVPAVAADSPVHREVLLEGGVLAEPAAFGDAVSALLDSADTRRRHAVLAADRGRAFSWHDAAERVWALHAEL